MVSCVCELKHRIDSEIELANAQVIDENPKVRKSASNNIPIDPVEDRKTLDHLYSSLLYCGMLLEGNVKCLFYAFVLQFTYCFGVSAKFFEKFTFEDLYTLSAEEKVELINS